MKKRTVKSAARRSVVAKKAAPKRRSVAKKATRKSASLQTRVMRAISKIFGASRKKA